MNTRPKPASQIQTASNSGGGFNAGFKSGYDEKKIVAVLKEVEEKGGLVLPKKFETKIYDAFKAHGYNGFDFRRVEDSLKALGPDEWEKIIPQAFSAEALAPFNGDPHARQKISDQMSSMLGHRWLEEAEHLENKLPNPAFSEIILQKPADYFKSIGVDLNKIKSEAVTHVEKLRKMGGMDENEIKAATEDLLHRRLMVESLKTVEKTGIALPVIHSHELSRSLYNDLANHKNENAVSQLETTIKNKAKKAQNAARRAIGSGHYKDKDMEGGGAQSLKQIGKFNEEQLKKQIAAQKSLQEAYAHNLASGLGVSAGVGAVGYFAQREMDKRIARDQALLENDDIEPVAENAAKKRIEMNKTFSTGFGVLKWSAVVGAVDAFVGGPLSTFAGKLFSSAKNGGIHR